jgi:hypothetical protein
MGVRTELIDLENVDEKEGTVTHTEIIRTSDPDSFEV